VSTSHLTHRAAKPIAAALAAGALLLGTAAGSAAADDKKPLPPERMSDVGGDLLAQPGTQVQLGPGAPELPKKLSGRSWVVADAESGKILAAHNPHWKLAPASTLKMLFAETLLPKFPKETEHKVTSAELKNLGAGSSTVGIKENLTYTVRDLWLGVFLRSGNDAVHVLTAMNGGKAKTVAEMQARAQALGADDTTVVEPDGYDARGQTSSAYDLTLIARAGMQNPDFREYAATARAKFPGEVKKGKRETFEIQNTNRLLTGDYDLDVYQGIAGIKNGNTTEAGSTFTGVAERDGKVLLVTVMNPGDGHNRVYEEAAQLFDWGFEAAPSTQPVGELVPPDSAQGEEGKKPGESDDRDAKPGAKPVASAKNQGGGHTMALTITAGSLLLLAVGGFFIHRRWPLPELVRRGRPAGAEHQKPGHEADPEE
jgi:D-alanyl-D-alanine carboxypeptidase (penicillin-binding protein 5/6)